MVNVEIQTHADTGRSKGWALVRFTSPNEAQLAIAQYNLSEFHDRGKYTKLDMDTLFFPPK